MNGRNFLDGKKPFSLGLGQTADGDHFGTGNVKSKIFFAMEQKYLSRLGRAVLFLVTALSFRRLNFAGRTRRSAGDNATTHACMQVSRSRCWKAGGGGRIDVLAIECLIKTPKGSALALNQITTSSRIQSQEPQRFEWRVCDRFLQHMPSKSGCPSFIPTDSSALHKPHQHTTSTWISKLLFQEGPFLASRLRWSPPLTVHLSRNTPRRETKKRIPCFKPLLDDVVKTHLEGSWNGSSRSRKVARFFAGWGDGAEAGR
jgi:hypothetical protein